MKTKLQKKLQNPAIRRTLTALAATLALGIFSASQARAIIIYPVNDGFEDPNLGTPSDTNTGAEDPGAGYGWTFVGNAGITANGGVLGTTGATNGNMSNGDTSAVGQAGYIQANYGNAEISQDVSGFVTGTAVISFDLETRPDYGANPIDVRLDDTSPGGATNDLGTFTSISSTAFTPFSTLPVDVIAGDTYDLQFIGEGVSPAADVLSFVDNVSILNTATPEPSTYGLFLVGALTLGWLGWNRTVRRTT
jgi:hypothetical protein